MEMFSYVSHFVVYGPRTLLHIKSIVPILFIDSFKFYLFLFIKEFDKTLLLLNGSEFSLFFLR